MEPEVRSLSIVELRKSDGIATLRLDRGKVNAINDDMVAAIRGALRDCDQDDQVRAVIVTGTGKFFSFGFDVPELYPWDRDRFTRFIEDFTDLYAEMFLFRKPVVAAINGHAVAGGCMLALTCDYRMMTRGGAKISLNEVNFGSTVFAGSMEMLRFATGSANASTIHLSGNMYEADDALSLGLIDAVGDDALPIAREMAAKHQPAFGSLKSLLRKPIVDEFRRREADAIREFVEIWYSPATRAELQKIRIR
jgi:enoyl-CoA hydratase/carnithine racemase